MKTILRELQTDFANYACPEPHLYATQGIPRYFSALAADYPDATHSFLFPAFKPGTAGIPGLPARAIPIPGLPKRAEETMMPHPLKVAEHRQQNKYWKFHVRNDSAESNVSK